MMQRYIVLRDSSPPAERAERSGRGAPEPDAIAASCEEHGPDHDLDRDDSVLQWAPAMPTALVAPRAKRAPAAAIKPAVAWGVKAVNADASKFDGRGVTVAVLDTGIDAAHPAFRHLEGRRFERMDFTGEGNDDGDGHGTHCAGTIFGGDVDGTRIGIAPGVRAVYIGKVLDSKGHGSTDALVEGLLWAARNRAQVIAMSLGIDYPGYVQQLRESMGLPLPICASRALEAFRTTLLLFAQVMGLMKLQVKDGVLIAAAGNESDRDTSPEHTVSASVPAVIDGVVSVGALGPGTDGLRIAPFSNTDPVVSAPGVDILSAAPGGGLALMSGTSMAAPHVAGVAALWAQKLRESGSQSFVDLRARTITSVTTQGLSPAALARDIGAGLVLAP